jgi:hypothetical protein
MGTLLGCRKDLAPENPCGDYKQPTADFMVEQSTGEVVITRPPFSEYVWYANPFVRKDTVLDPGLIQFRSEFKDTNIYRHTWYIGSQVFRDYKAWRDFSSVTPPAYITIHHVMRWKPNLFCNPLETGYDSVSFTFKVSDRLKDFATFGKYRMVYDTLGAPSIQDSVEIEFYRSIRNYKDSIANDPRLYDGTQNRIKGLYSISINADKIYYVVPSNSELLNSYRLISNSYAIFKGGVIDDLKIYLSQSKLAFIEYENYDPQKFGYSKKYKLKGRKLDN